MKYFKIILAVTLSLVLVGCGESMTFKMDNSDEVKVSTSGKTLTVKFNGDEYEIDDIKYDITNLRYSNLIIPNLPNGNAISIIVVDTDGKCDYYYAALSVANETGLYPLTGLCYASQFRAGTGAFGMSVRIEAFHEGILVFSDNIY